MKPSSYIQLPSTTIDAHSQLIVSSLITNRNELSFYNPRMEQITEAGEFHVFIASSSADEGLETRFTLSEDWLPVRDSREEQQRLP